MCWGYIWINQWINLSPLLLVVFCNLIIIIIHLLENSTSDICPTPPLWSEQCNKVFKSQINTKRPFIASLTRFKSWRMRKLSQNSLCNLYSLGKWAIYTNAHCCLVSFPNWCFPKGNHHPILLLLDMALGIAVTTVINRLCVGREEGVCLSDQPSLHSYITDTLVTDLNR